jgi:cholest-4-en-3-one 26-monooxygenase
VANAKINGAPLPMLELLSYLLVLVVAGNETTRNATTGGLLALIEHPDRFRRLKREPESSSQPSRKSCDGPPRSFSSRVLRLRTRWFAGRKFEQGRRCACFIHRRIATKTCLRGPFKFDIGHNPNPHLGFGIGEHFCLGSNLARLELEVIFRELGKRLEHRELAGVVERLRSSFVGGIKHMPIRYKLNSCHS